MRHGLRFYHVLAGALGVAACAFGAARGADDPKKELHNKPYTFESADGVKLSGYLWSNAGQPNKKDATIILLHDMTKEGGSSRDAGWDDLAEKLLTEGYSVFSFDFRGYGDSTQINPDKFWDLRKNPQNKLVRGSGKTPPPDTIKRADLEHAYYPYLVNDVAAAKAFLDRRNDSGEVNTSSVFVIGAGQGATIGALWMASQWHLQKADVGPLNNILIDPKTGKFSLQEPEGKDQAGAFWLSVSPTLAERGMTTSLHSWLGEAGGADRVPMVFLYGEKDEAAKKVAGDCLQAVVTGYRAANEGAMKADEATEKKDEDLKNRRNWKLPDTFKYKIEGTELGGSKLLGGDLNTDKLIVNSLNSIMKDRKNLETRKRDNDGAAFVWNFPKARVTIKAKEPMDPTLPILDPRIEPQLVH